ncbi:hypothetical protein GGS20DRAFT_138932 [Poronia punctata]|nr:hypothetical protein GGS20DRAFT_138932 [Poronia punctata]
MQLDPQGNKVACGPCIRGHRSSSCKHDDRQLLRVNKPGRPLSTCPHPKGSGCNCNTRVTIAIPRNRKCACGPASGTSTSNSSTATTTSDSTPQLSKRMGSSRVQKNAVSIPPPRKQSLDLALLERMDPETINLIPSQTSSVGANGHMVHFDTPSSLGPIPAHLTSSAAPTGTPLSSPPWIHSQAEMQFSQGLTDSFVSSHGLAPNRSPNDSPLNSVSGRSSLEALGTQNHTPASSVDSFAEEYPTEGGSCCGGKGPVRLPPVQEQATEVKPRQSRLNLMDYATPVSAQSPSLAANFFPQTAFDMPMNYAATSQPLRHGSTAHTYPFPWGSFQAPLQYSQWEQMVANPQQNIAPHDPFAGSQVPNAQASETDDGSCTTHECTCGPGCECVGCTVHPFNSATKELVRSMVVDPVLEANGFTAGSTNMSHPANGSTFGIVPLQLANGSPTSGTMFENSMPLCGSESWDDYLIVEYGNFFGCKGDLGTCPCGDDCVCAGCTFHRPTQAATPTS